MLVTRIGQILMWGGIAAMVWMTFSCEEFCEESNRTAVVVSFYSSSKDEPEAMKVHVRGIENDSLLFPNPPLFPQTSYLQVLLPVNPTADVMSFLIKNDEMTADTIVIHYNRHNGFISSECGCVTYAEIQDDPEITKNSVKRMVVTNHKVNTVSYRQGVVNAENIRIYY